MPSAERRVVLQNLTPSMTKWETGDSDAAEVAQEVKTIKQQLRFERLQLSDTRLTFIQGYAVDSCGAVGNCMFWILDQTDRPILEGVSGKEFSVLHSHHHRLPDILLGIHDSASQTTQVWYQYDGKKYRAAKCAIDTYGIPYTDNKRHRGFGPCEKLL